MADDLAPRLVAHVRDTLLLPDDALAIEIPRPEFMLDAKTPVYEALGSMRGALVQLAVL